MAEITVQDLEDHDIRHAAIHECAHAIIARHYGLKAFPVIWHNPNGSLEGDKFWRGQTHHEPGSALRSRRIAIAGLMAEEMSNYDSTDEFDEICICASIEPDSIDDYEGCEWSPSDWDAAKGWTEHDAHAVYMILKRNWQALIEEAGKLIAAAKDSGIAVSNG
jgi:hypothetical protein